MKVENCENTLNVYFEQPEKFCQLNSQYPLAPQPKENEDAPEAAVATTVSPSLFLLLLLRIRYA
jgi:hypothetical protein